MDLLKKANGNLPRTEEQKLQMIEDAAKHYGEFLEALGFDWKADPHSDRTPHRVAKAWVNDLIAGSISAEPVMSMCAHHNLTFSGVAHVAYICGKEKTDMVVGLSKLNRIVDFYSRRPNIQESLTKQIHDHVDKLCTGNRGVAVVIESQHNCVKCRGIKHDSVMKTSQMSGRFIETAETRTEFFNLIDQSRYA